MNPKSMLGVICHVLMFPLVEANPPNWSPSKVSGYTWLVIALRFIASAPGEANLINM